MRRLVMSLMILLLTQHSLIGQEGAGEQTSVLELVERANRLSDQAGDRTPALDFSLGGEWKLLLPAGFERQVNINMTSDGSYEIGPRHLTFAGHYRYDGEYLVCVRGVGSNPELCAWRIRSPYMLVLELQSGNVGADYRSAVLFRSKPDATEEETDVRQASGSSPQVPAHMQGDDVSFNDRRTKWEYDVHVVGNSLEDHNRLPDLLTYVGNNGWELTGILDGDRSRRLIFKRPAR